MQKGKLILLQGRGDKEKFNAYRKELDFIKKMMEEKYDIYITKAILGYRRGKT